MEQARGLRGWAQGFFFPDLYRVLDAVEQLDRRLSQMDKSVSLLDASVDQIDKGMVQFDQGMNRLDKDMVLLHKSMVHLDNGMRQLNSGTDNQEQQLATRLELLKGKLEDDHARAMGEIAALLNVPALVWAREHAGPIFPVVSEQVLELTEREPVAAISEPTPAPISEPITETIAVPEAYETSAEQPAENARARSELSRLLGLPVQVDEEGASSSKKPNGQGVPQDFAAILAHIRGLHLGTSGVAAEI